MTTPPTLTLSGVNIAEEEKHWIWRHDFADPAKHAEMEQVWGRMAERAREWWARERLGNIPENILDSQD